MKAFNVYLNFKGITEEAFIFYKSIFGGEFLWLQRFKDTPEKEKLSPAEQEMIMHIALPIGDGNILMGSDFLESMGHTFIAGNNFYLSVNTQSNEETDKIFSSLSAGGKIEMPLQDTFWGAYFGMLTDKYGIHWMVSYDKKPLY
ncbi:MAG: VOC family protein [Bacteroidota bacterium]|nr:VOC family protein [Bacteroidota bacterium]